MKIPIFTKKRKRKHKNTFVFLAYSNGQVGIVDLERQQVIHTVDYKTDIWKAYFSPLIHVDKYSELNSKSTEVNSRDLQREITYPMGIIP